MHTHIFTQTAWECRAALDNAEWHCCAVADSFLRFCIEMPFGTAVSVSDSVQVSLAAACKCQSAWYFFSKMRNLKILKKLPVITDCVVCIQSKFRIFLINISYVMQYRVKHKIDTVCILIFFGWWLPSQKRNIDVITVCTKIR